MSQLEWTRVVLKGTLKAGILGRRQSCLLRASSLESAKRRAEDLYPGYRAYGARIC